MGLITVRAFNLIESILIKIFSLIICKSTWGIFNARKSQAVARLKPSDQYKRHLAVVGRRPGNSDHSAGAERWRIGYYLNVQANNRLTFCPCDMLMVFTCVAPALSNAR